MPSIEQITNLLAKEPDDAFLNFALAMELARSGRAAESIAQFDRVIALDPNYTAAYFQKARTLIASGQIEPAKSVLRLGIERAQAIGNAHAAGEMGELLASL
jgi:predicted Zn-dependent protease